MHGRGQVGDSGISESLLGQSGWGPGTGTGFLGQLGLLVAPCVYMSGFSMGSQEVPLPLKPGNGSYSAPNCLLDWWSPLLRNQEERGQKQDRGFSCRTKGERESPRHRLTGTENGKGQGQLQCQLSSKTTGHWDTELRLEDKGSSCKLLAQEPNDSIESVLLFCEDLYWAAFKMSVLVEKHSGNPLQCWLRDFVK